MLSGTKSESRIVAVASLLLVVLTLALYSSVLHFGFVAYDDPLYVTQNVHVQQGLTAASIKWAFAFGPGHAFNYHPLTWLSHMLDAQLYGNKPRLHHLTSVILHALASGALLLFLWSATRRLWPSIAVAALFAWHPMHVESVAWVAERKDVLSALLMFLTLLAYVRYTRTETTWRRWYALALIFFALGLLAKSMLVTLPFVLLLLDFWPLRRPWSKSLLLEKIPFFAFAAFISVLTYIAQKTDGALQRDDSCPMVLRLMNIPVAYVRYIAKLFWPTHLSAFYPYQAWAGWQVAGAVAILLVITAVVIVRRRSGYALVGWLWFVGMLVPVIGLVQAGMQSMADRYSYLPSVGLFIVVCYSIDGWAKTPLRRRATAAIAIFVLLALASATFAQIQYWQDEATLFTHAADVVPNNYLAEGRIGRELAAQNDVAGAFYHYQRSLAINPDHFDAQYNLANLLLRNGRSAEAIEHYRRAIALHPQSVEAHGNLGIALTNAGNLDEAQQQLREVVRLDPTSIPARLAWGRILLNLGQKPQAAEQFRAALQISPGLKSAQQGLDQAAPATQP